MSTVISTKTSGVGGLTVTGDASGILQLASADGTTAVTIDASQNVGIGTSSPTAKAQIGDSTVVTTNRLVFGKAQTASESNLPAIGQQSAGGGNDLALAATSTSGNVRFYTGASTNSGEIGTGSNAERARIDSSGNLLVGSTTNTTNTKGLISYDGNVNNGFALIDTTGTTAGTRYSMFFQRGTAIGVGSISTTTSTTAFNTSSDYRLKENVLPMVGALQTVVALKPVTYTWKVDGSDGQGFIAHELQAVVPDCVTGEKDAVNEDGSIKPQGIDTSFLVATLTAAIQELKAIIDTQNARIEALEAK